MYTWVCSGMSNPKAWLEFGFTHHLRLNKGKELLGFWAGPGKLWEGDQGKDGKQVA